MTSIPRNPLAIRSPTVPSLALRVGNTKDHSHAQDIALPASQASSKADAAFHQGEDLTLTATMAPATNITGWTLTFTIKKQYGDAAALLTKTVGGGITITDAANGVFQVALASADTAALETRQYVFDIQRTTSGNRTVLTIGNLTVLPQVTL